MRENSIPVLLSRIDDGTLVLERGRQIIREGLSARFRTGTCVIAVIWFATEVFAGSPSPLPASQFVRLAPWSKEGASPDTGFGGWIAPAGDVNGDGFSDVLLSGPNADHDRGEVFLYLGSAEGLSSQCGWASSGESRAALFGAIASGVGDINGDGFADVMIGAPYQENGAIQRAGCAYLFLGSAKGLSSRPVWVYRGKSELWDLGGLVEGAGDVNGDGFSDVVISAAHFSRAGVQLGRLMIFYGSKSGLGSEPDWIQDGDQPNANFGQTATCAGDVNHDGFDDLIVGVPHYDGNLMDEGKAFLFLGSRNGLSHSPAWTALYDSNQKRSVGSAQDQLFANTVSAVGDVNHDGFADVLVTAYFAEKNERDEGLAFVYLGCPSGLSNNAEWIVQGNQESAMFGSSGAGIGDVNGDGFPDIIVGARQASHGQLREGGAFVFYGSAKGLHTSPDWTTESEQALAGLGRGVARAGDVNGDGFNDVLVSATEFSRNGERVGKVWLHYGGSLGLAGSSGWKLQPPWFAMVSQRVNAIMFRRGFLIASITSAVMAILLFGLWRFRRKSVDSQRLATQRQCQITEERERFARDIHDGIGTDLQHLAILSQTATRNSRDADERLSRINEQAQYLAVAVKELVWLRNPTHDSLSQFADYISEYAANYFEPTSLRCELAFPTSLPHLCVPPELRHQMLLIVKEACHNIVKHAHASVVRVVLEHERNLLRLIIADDGRGFDLNRSSSLGNGLSNLQRRTSEIGGHLHIATGPGQGTKVQIEVTIDNSLRNQSEKEIKRSA